MIKKVLSAIALCLASTLAWAQKPAAPATVYFTSEITPEALVAIFEQLGVSPEGNVAVKISTGESEQSHMLSPELIARLVRKVNGTLVECNTAYRGNRFNTADHRKAIAERGYDKIAAVDIMDEDGNIFIPMADSTYFSNDIVGSHLDRYDFMINLAHFKGHQMGGFGGFKLLGVKPQTDDAKLAACDALAYYLASGDVQAARYDALQWGPSNLEAQKLDAIQTNAALSALAAQLSHCVGQGQYPNDYWSLATALADSVIAGEYDNYTDEQLLEVLQTFQDTAISYAAN